MLSCIDTWRTHFCKSRYLYCPRIYHCIFIIYCLKWYMNIILQSPICIDRSICHWAQVMKKQGQESEAKLKDLFKAELIDIHWPGWCRRFKQPCFFLDERVPLLMLYIYNYIYIYCISCLVFRLFMYRVSHWAEPGGFPGRCQATPGATGAAKGLERDVGQDELIPRKAGHGWQAPPASSLKHLPTKTWYSCCFFLFGVQVFSHFSRVQISH